jgi:hypothetical protein
MEVMGVAGMQHADAGSSPPNVDVLVEGIRELLHMAQKLGQAGVPVNLPPRLVQVCREVLDEVDGPPSDTHRANPITDSQRSVADKALRELPLRRLLLQVIAPGESVTVPEVVDRLAKVGVRADSAKVSNALGYQVDRGPLIREHRGLYTYPVDASSADATGTTVPADASVTGAAGVSIPNDQRQSGDDPRHRAATVRGEEDSRGRSAAQGRKKAV